MPPTSGLRSTRLPVVSSQRLARSERHTDEMKNSQEPEPRVTYFDPTSRHGSRCGCWFECVFCRVSPGKKSECARLQVWVVSDGTWTTVIGVVPTVTPFAQKRIARDRTAEEMLFMTAQRRILLARSPSSGDDPSSRFTTLHPPRSPPFLAGNALPPYGTLR